MAQQDDDLALLPKPPTKLNRGSFRASSNCRELRSLNRRASPTWQNKNHDSQSAALSKQRPEGPRWGKVLTGATAPRILRDTS